MTAEQSPVDWTPIIRPVEEGDLEALPALENSAGTLFREVPELAWLADGDDLSVSRYRELAADGASWVAVDAADRPIAFLCGSIEPDALHIWEFGVRRDLQRRGVGRLLIGRAIEAAVSSGLSAITLTTFRDVPWNAPLYQKLGFEILEGAAIGERLLALLKDEIRRGLPIKLRCAMRLGLVAS